MDPSLKRLLFWTPRVICILFTMFLSIFALDVFDGNYSFLETILAFLIHLIPNFIMIIVLVISWRWEWVGAVLFTSFGVWYIATSWGRFPLSVYVTIAGPLFLLGVLFLFNWIYREQLRTR